MGSGVYVIGKHLYLDVAPHIRSQVMSRAYHLVPRPPLVCLILL